jgi:antitoxin ParD1/3/4
VFVAGQKINGQWRRARLKQVTGFAELPSGDWDFPCGPTVFLECGQTTVGILAVGVGPQVDVFGVTHMAVTGGSVPADHHVFDLVFLEHQEQVVEVFWEFQGRVLPDRAVPDRGCLSVTRYTLGWCAGERVAVDQVGEQSEVVLGWGCFVLDGLVFESGDARGAVLSLGAALVWAGHGCPGVRWVGSRVSKLMFIQIFHSAYHLVRSMVICSGMASVEKISVSLPAPLVRFLEHYQTENAVKTRSEVVERAIALLREQNLEREYRESSLENDPIWDVTVADGLNEPY